MKTSVRARLVQALISAIFSLGSTCGTHADGIPEPSLLMYGVIRNVSGSDNIRLSFGTLTWRFQPANDGPTITVSTGLTNINDQFSYILRVPCELPVLGFPVSSNRLQLTSIPTVYGRWQVDVDGHAASFVQAGLTNLTLSSQDRGRIERVDLQTSFIPPDTDFNGLPDDWERQYFGRTGVDPFDDPDHDGMSNWEEYQAGTDPNNDQSLFKIVEIRPHLPGILMRWSSILGKKYSVERSGDLLVGFTATQTNLSATPSLNTFRDTTAVGPGPYFYRLRVER